jgi:hypothetical protein
MYYIIWATIHYLNNLFNILNGKKIFLSHISEFKWFCILLVFLFISTFHFLVSVNSTLLTIRIARSLISVPRSGVPSGRVSVVCFFVGIAATSSDICCDHVFASILDLSVFCLDIISTLQGTHTICFDLPPYFKCKILITSDRCKDDSNFGSFLLDK